MRLRIRATTPILIAALAAACAPDSESPEPAPDPAVAERLAARAAELAVPIRTDGRWPGFRGPAASGVADGQDLPDSWNGETGENVRWKTPIPGLAHSSPIVWGDLLFVTTAISESEDATFRPGLYGDGSASEDRSVHLWKVLALDRETGEIVWERTAHEGVPIDKRHVKATYANSTPATDGRYVVALFGSEGLFAYDLEGDLVWRHDLGRLDAGAYDDPEYEWGSASSPIIHGDRVYVQCDTQERSFVVALDVRDGSKLWETPRDELPSWGTPTIWPEPDREVLVLNGSNFIRGYDPESGEELWRLGGSSQITAPTPVFEPRPGGLLIVSSGRRPEKPIFAVRPGARGDISLNEDETSNEYVAWSWVRRGPYMPTPLVYRGQLYVLGNVGIFDSYELTSGETVYRERIPHAGSGFSASPVAADGKLYLPGEDGDVFVVRAGPTFEVVATNPLHEPIMASPALSGGTLYVRARDHLFAIGDTGS